MKRVLSLAVILAMFIPSFTAVCVSAEEYDTKTIYTNVAEGKPVATNVELENDEQSQKWGAASLTDGDLSTMTLMLGKSETEYFTVDLGQRYKISEIKLYDRRDSAQVPEARCGIRILLSDDADFEVYETADEIGNTNEESFTEGGSWNIGLSGKRAYRYVRFERCEQRENWWFFYNELEVYANVEMNNVSAGRKAYSNDWFDKENDAEAVNNYSPSVVLDNEISMDNRWLSYYGEKGEKGFTYLAVDLQQARNIGYIELERVDNSQTSIEQFYSDFDIYLSNKYEPDVLFSDSTLKDNPDYLWISGCGRSSAAQWQNGVYAVWAGGEKYRYVIYKHNKENCLSELGAVRVYEPVPEADSAEFDGTGINISFNDELDADEIRKLRVYDQTADRNIDVSIQKKDAYTYTLISGQLSAEHSYNIIIPEGVSSLKGWKTVKSTSLPVRNAAGLTASDITVTDKDGKICDRFLDNSLLRISAEVTNNTTENKKVRTFAAVYRNGVLQTVKSDEKVIPQEGADRCNVKLDCSGTQDNDIVKIFVWDVTDGTQKPIKEIQEVAEQSNEIYVSPNGDDSGSGTVNNPYKTIERAKERVREINTDMQSDISVFLYDGIYQLSETLNFSARDGGTNGYNVNYKALGNRAEISGGRTVSGWSRYSDKIWCADYYDGEYVRQLTVNGRSAIRAKSADMVEIADFYKDNIGYNPLENTVYDGLILSDSKYASYRNPEDIQIHTASGWKSYLLNTESISEDKDRNSRFKLPPESFFECTRLENQHRIYPGYHIWIENAFEELDEPGEFYYDREEKKIYYYPREDEAIETAEVQAASLEKLVSINGENYSEPVKNITFDGITFAHAAWSRPSYVGLVNDQAQMMLPAQRDICIAGDSGFSAVPSNISIGNAAEIYFKNNRIYDMGAVALGLNQGVSDCVFMGNTFCDIADSAITIGNMDIPFEDKVYSGRNLTPGGVITASSFAGKNYPQNAVNGDVRTLWAPKGDGACWWQIDFGSPQKIDRIEFETRYGSSDDAGNHNIEIYGANSDDMSDREFIGRTGEESTDGTLTVQINTHNKYRFIRFEKSYYMTLANVRIINGDLPYTPAVKLCENNTIDGNYITRTGLTNYGAPAIQAYYTKSTKITDNYITDIPYSGICAGWGWETYSDNTDSGEITISRNRIEDYLHTAYDGGGIYLLGGMPDTEVYENYLCNQVNGLAAIYLDAGTIGCRIYDNVSEDVPAAYAASNATKDDVIENNYSTSVICHSPMSEADFKNNSVFAPGVYSTKITEIIERTGGVRAEQIALAGKNYSPVRREYMLINAADTKAQEGEYMSDSYFARWWLGIYLDSAETWLETSGGQFGEQETAAFAEFVGNTKKLLDGGLTERSEIINLYWQFVDKKNQLKASKT